MSGIVAFINRRGCPIDRCLLRELTGRMVFRGPDGTIEWDSELVGFGSTLLRTNPDSPVCHAIPNIDAQLFIVADVRLDGRDELSGRLGLADARVQDLTDADLILRSYGKWGEGCVEYLRGDFAFVIWDQPAHRLFCARDPFGVKPLYHARTRDGLILGNTLNCLRAHPDISGRINEQAIGDFLLVGSNEDPFTTYFADIQRLPPAHTLSWTDGIVEIRRYWRLPDVPSEAPSSNRDLVDEFWVKLGSAVRDRLGGTRAHTAVSMSGGLDSTALACAAQELLSASGNSIDLTAYTVVFDRLIPDDERHYSTLTARKLDIPIQHLVADDFRLFEGWDVQPPPEPTEGASNIVSRTLVQQVQHRGGRVILNGEGGDAMLLPNPAFLIDLIRAGKLATWVRMVGSYLVSRRRFPPLGLRTWWKARTPNTLPPLPLPDLFSPVFTQRFAVADRWRELLQQSDPTHVTHPLAHRMLQGSGWSNLFENWDPGVTGIPVEWRFPYFDHRLIDFVFALPSFPHCIDKDILRMSLRGRLPEAVRTRRKTIVQGNPTLATLRSGGFDGSNTFSPESPVWEYADRKTALEAMSSFIRTGQERYYPAMRVLCLDRWFHSVSNYHSRPVSTEYCNAG